MALSKYILVFFSLCWWCKKIPPAVCLMVFRASPNIDIRNKTHLDTAKIRWVSLSRFDFCVSSKNVCSCSFAKKSFTILIIRTSSTINRLIFWNFRNEILFLSAKSLSMKTLWKFFCDKFFHEWQKSHKTNLSHKIPCETQDRSNKSFIALILDEYFFYSWLYTRLRKNALEGVDANYIDLQILRFYVVVRISHAWQHAAEKSGFSALASFYLRNLFRLEIKFVDSKCENQILLMWTFALISSFVFCLAAF